jgi:hypothetical protein
MTASGKHGCVSLRPSSGGTVVEPRPVFDPNIPSVARTYDYLLGGKDNYPVDREIGEIFIQKFPGRCRSPWTTGPAWSAR